MLSAYPACFYEEKDGRYSVVFPDLNHLATFGETLDDALTMAVDCLAGYLFEAEKEGMSVAPPSNINDIDLSAEYDDYVEAFVNIITVDVEEYAKIHFEKSIKKTLTIPLWLNNMAVNKDINFSQILQSALKEKLNIRE
jgi:predicted RNase H-like HicB family nuclease